MKQYDLSVIIPSRNEMFLKNTIDSVLAARKINTEVVVILDGNWPLEPLEDHEDVTLIYHSESIGQRAGCNEAARYARGEYIMKLDAHCSVGDGFDKILVESAKELGDDVTQIPSQYNLHAFDWLCKDCDDRSYQGPTPEKCSKCDGKNMIRDIVWQRRDSRLTESWRFDRNLKFQYWREFTRRPENRDKDYIDTMSCLGACFFMKKSRYWELDGSDEEHGSWGQQGTEIACKSWLSGGRMITNRKTWFAHMFRTQGGDFGFPYPISNSDVNKARKRSNDMWKGNQWPKAVRDLNWIIDKFAPIPDWHDREHKGIIYYTDNKLNLKLAKKVQSQLKSINLPITSASRKPMPHFGDNVRIRGERGYMTMFRQILAALEQGNSEIVYFCEADVLYHPSHFEFTPEKKDVWYYNTNVWKVDSKTGKAVRTDDCRQVSGIAVYRDTAVNHYRKRLAILEKKEKELSAAELTKYIRKMGFEPGTHGRKEKVDDAKSSTWESEFPNLDIRHDSNLTETRWSKDKFRNKKYTKGWTESTVDKISGWDDLKLL